MFDLPKTYQQGMEEIVGWANKLDESFGHRFMLDCYKIYMEWKYVIETAPAEEEQDGK